MENIITFLVCTFSGVLTGLLGIGGGLVIVPFFISIFPLFNVEQFTLHQIIAISATCVFMNSATTVFYRRHQKYLPFSILAKLSIAIIIGTVLGSYLTTFASNQILFSIYISVGLISIFVITQDIYFDLQNSRFKFVIYIVFATIGAISSSIGIGGAVLFATALKCFMGKDTKMLLPSITILVLVHAFFAFISKLLLHEIIFFIIPIALFASLIGSKIGVKISEHLSSNAINKLMAIVLGFGIFRVLFELI